MSIRSGFLLAAVLLNAAPAGHAAAQEPPQSPTEAPPGGEVIPTTTPLSLSGIDPIIDEVVVEAPQPRYVAPTLRDSIGRIWAPVFINGKGPFRLVLDTGASAPHSCPRRARTADSDAGFHDARPRRHRLERRVDGRRGAARGRRFAHEVDPVADRARRFGGADGVSATKRSATSASSSTSAGTASRSRIHTASAPASA